MRSRGRPPSPAHYFEALREAAGRLPEGLVRLGDPAPPAALIAAESALGRKLPTAYAELLRSFNGVDLFGEMVVVRGVGDTPFGSLVDANRPPPSDELVIAETSEGDLIALGTDHSGRIHRISPDADERWLLGSTLERWLDATIAREEILYDPEGEFRLEAFEPDGEITAAYALKQAERAARRDPGSAFHQHDLGAALRRQGRDERAAQAFARATALDPTNPWPWFDLGRTQHATGDHAAAAESFQSAARTARDPAGARFLAWSLRCLVEQDARAAADQLRAEALRRHPGLVEDLSRAAEADPEDRDAHDLAALLRDPIPLRRRLPIAPPASSSPPRRR